MKYVEVVAGDGMADTVAAIAEKQGGHDFRVGELGEDGRRMMRLLIPDDRLQATLDSLQTVLGAESDAKIIVMPIEIALPQPDEAGRRSEDQAIAARESLYASVERDARLDGGFLLLVGLSALVAAIGMIENNVAVIIGAMVIAPLLGPNLAFGLGAALGDLALMRKAFTTGTAGVVFAVGLAVAVALVWRFPDDSPELLARTQAGYDTIALALASGAAAALSLTTGLSSVLVGVMVAVALLPPAVAFGLMLGHGHVDLAFGAGLLLAVNIVCINLATKIVFLFKGIRPRTWLEKTKAQRAMTIHLIVWGLSLVALVFSIYARSRLSVVQ